MFTSKPTSLHGGKREPNGISTKIFDSTSYQSIASDSKMGGELAKTIVSKPRNDLEATKYESYKDASQVIRKRATIAQNQNRRSVLSNKEIPNNAENQALRRVRNSGSVVPKKVQNRPTNK
jgi:hypothetical protein